MRSVFSICTMTVGAILFSLNTASAGFPAPPGLPGAPNVSVRINGFLPPPPHVQLHVDSGRPYYVERSRRVYLERERPAKYYKHKKNRHDNRGRNKHDRRGH